MNKTLFAISMAAFILLCGIIPLNAQVCSPGSTQCMVQGAPQYANTQAIQQKMKNVSTPQFTQNVPSQQVQSPIPAQQKPVVAAPPVPPRPQPVATPPRPSETTGKHVVSNPADKFLISESQNPGDPSIEIPKNNQTIVLPEIATQVALSNSDINRVVCPNSDIKDVVYSKEKGVTVKINGKNAFLKYHVFKKDHKDVYVSTPTEIFVVCGDHTYNIIGIPKRIPSQTVNLSKGKADTIKKNQAMFSGIPFEKKVINLIKKVYTEEIPESFSVINVNKGYNLYQQVSINLRRAVTIEGEGLTLKEYTVRIKDDSAFAAILIKEKDFLRTEISSKPLAVSIDISNLKKGETARVFVVEKTEGM